MGRPGQKAQRLQHAAAHSENFQSDVEGGLHDYNNLTSNPEEQYTLSAPLAHRKRFAQFFTPPEIAKLMAEWVMANNPRSALDPACGTGLFVRTLLNLNAQLAITAVDIDSAILSFARNSLPKSGHNVKLVNANYLLSQPEAEYDAILLNPPYLRHHDFSYKDELVSRYSAKTKISFSRLSNIYVFFIIDACLRLKPSGRAAIIVPVEWANANYGAPLKQFLLQKGYLKEVVYFDHADSVFADALTTACVLKIENSPAPKSISVEKWTEGRATKHEADAHALLTSKKWESIVNQDYEEAPDGFVHLRAFASTRRGIATGANDFFCVTTKTASELGIQAKHRVGCIMRAADVNSYIFDASDFGNLAKHGQRTVLIALSRDLSSAEKCYINEGVTEGLNNRYLVAQRKPWYSMEALSRAPIWAAVFGRKGLRFILNDASVCNLTAFHGIFPHSKGSEFSGALVACLNSATVQQLAKQVLRVYGGGLLKVEPRDLLDLLVPDLTKVSESTLRYLSSLLKKLDNAQRCSENIESIEAELDEAVLAAGRQAHASDLGSNDRHQLRLI